jgi:hypothetical protein
VKSPWGDRPWLPREILDQVVAHARELGREVASDDLLLLAVAGLAEAHPARGALAEEGVDVERLLARVHTSGDRRRDPRRGLTFAPAAYELMGWAEGFAAASGDGRITPEHALLAVLWDPMSASSHLLWQLGVSRERVVERLRELRAPVPAAPVPSQRENEWGEYVWFERDQVQRVLHHLGRHLPPGTPWAGTTRTSAPAYTPRRASRSRIWSERRSRTAESTIRPGRARQGSILRITIPTGVCPPGSPFSSGTTQLPPAPTTARVLNAAISGRSDIRCRWGSVPNRQGPALPRCARSGRCRGLPRDGRWRPPDPAGRGTAARSRLPSACAAGRPRAPCAPHRAHAAGHAPPRPPGTAARAFSSTSTPRRS